MSADDDARELDAVADMAGGVDPFTVPPTAGRLWDGLTGSIAAPDDDGAAARKAQRDRLLYAAGFAAGIGVLLLALAVIARRAASPCADCGKRGQHEHEPTDLGVPVVPDRASYAGRLGRTEDRSGWVDGPGPGGWAPPVEVIVDGGDFGVLPTDTDYPTDLAAMPRLSLADDEQLISPAVDPQAFVEREPAEDLADDVAVKVPDFGQPVDHVTVAVAPQE